MAAQASVAGCGRHDLARITAHEERPSNSVIKPSSRPSSKRPSRSWTISIPTACAVSSTRSLRQCRHAPCRRKCCHAHACCRRCSHPSRIAASRKHYRRRSQLCTGARVTARPISARGFSTISAGSSFSARADISRATRSLAGTLVLGPDTYYPPHHHVAEEIYVPLTGGAEWRMGDAEFTKRDAGEVIYHASNVSHAMRTGNEPLLALYFGVAAILHSVQR